MQKISIDNISLQNISLQSIELPNIGLPKSSLKINPNLISGTQDWSGNWSNKNYWQLTNEYYEGCRVASRSQLWQGIYKQITLEEGKTYTFSAYVKADIGIRYILETQPSPVNGVYIYPAIANPKNITHINGDGKWQRVFLSFIATGNGYIRPRFEIETISGSGKLYIAGYKLEEGSKATPWCPSIQDNLGIATLELDEDWGTGYEEGVSPEYDL